MIAIRPVSACQSPPARPASSIVAVIEPGPLMIGIASGNAATLRMRSIVTASLASSCLRWLRNSKIISKAM